MLARINVYTKLAELSQQAKMRFSIKDFFGKCAQFLADSVEFAEEILH